MVGGWLVMARHASPVVIAYKWRFHPPLDQPLNTIVSYFNFYYSHERYRPVVLNDGSSTRPDPTATILNKNSLHVHKLYRNASSSTVSDAIVSLNEVFTIR